MLCPSTKCTFWLWQKGGEVYNCIFKGEKRLYKKRETQKYGAHIKGEFISNALNYLIILWMNAWYHWGRAKLKLVSKLNYLMLLLRGSICDMPYPKRKGEWIKERGRELISEHLDPSTFKNSVYHISEHAHIRSISLYMQFLKKWSMFCHHQKGRDCWLQDDFDDNNTLSLLTDICLSYMFCRKFSKSFISSTILVQMSMYFRHLVKKNPTHI